MRDLDDMENWTTEDWMADEYATLIPVDDAEDEDENTADQLTI
jgi:hypothetical protein